jgi:hypothetical protein
VKPIIAAALVASAVLTVCSQGPAPEVTRAAQLFARLEKTLLGQPDVGPMLQSSRALAVGLLRSAPRLAKAWQMQPSFVEALTDDELLAFVTARSNATLVCGLDIMSRVPLETLTPQTIESLDVRGRYAPAAGVGAPRLSSDCATIENADGRPAKLQSRSDFGAVMPGKLQPFIEGAPVAFRTQARTRGAVFTQNQKYLASVAGSRYVDQEVTAAARRFADGATVVSGRVLNLRVLAAVRGDSANLVLFLPLSQ